MIVALLLLAASAGPDPCVLSDPAPVPNRLAAQAYLEAGDAERDAGSMETASAAYRQASRLDPSSARARESFASACRSAARSAELQRGRELMNGDRQAAIVVFQKLRATGRDPQASLLEGICRYEEGEDDQARLLLEEARGEAGLADSANYFLGLIELRDGDAGSAAGRFEQVVASGQGLLAERAGVLLGAARRTGRAVLSVFAESGYDSNVNFTPDGMPAAQDGGTAGGASLSLRPLGISGPYLRASGFYRKQIQTPDWDVGDFAATAGWRIGRGQSYALVDYTYEMTLLGGNSDLSAHRPRVGVRWRIGNVALGGVYAARFGQYQAVSASRFSGVLHTLDPEISYRFPLGSVIGLVYHLGRDSTTFADTTSFEHGPRLFATAVLGSGWRLSAEASYLYRVYDAAAVGDPAPRSDRFVYGGAAVEKDVGERWTLRLSGGDRIATSNLSGYSYSRITALFGVTYYVGLL